MFEFIVLLRALSAMIITNAHYENIYPLSIIANGGLLGDVMFFAVSGFCLYDIKMDFFNWYKKRLLRIYPSVWIITFLYTLLGYYSSGDVRTLLSSFIFPTHYHFVGTIVLLYIPFYFIAYISKQNENKSKVLICSFLIVFASQMLIYLFVYDKSLYHIDSVYEPMIRLLFFEAMLIGAYMRVNAPKFTSDFRRKDLFVSISFFIVYFLSKISLVRYESLAKFQIINQYILLCLLASLFMLAMGIEKAIKKNKKSLLSSIFKYISSITLEIYLVQYALIYWFNLGGFPVNFFIVTTMIVIMATLLHKLTIVVTRRFAK